MLVSVHNTEIKLPILDSIWGCIKILKNDTHVDNASKLHSR